MRKKDALFNIVFSFVLQIITIICGFIIPKLIIVNYGSNVNGLIVSITKFLKYIVLIEVGFGPVVKSILYKPIANKDKTRIAEILKASEKFFRIVAYILIVYVVILCVVLPIILSNEFEAFFIISLIIIISISVIAEYFLGMTYKLYLEAEQKAYIVSIISLCTLVLNTIFTVVLIYLGVSIQIVKLVTAIIFVIRPILLMVYIKNKYNIDLKEVKGNYNIKQKWDGLAQHIAFIVYNNTDVVILTLFTNTAEVSVYYIYSLIVYSVKNIVASFSTGIEDIFGNMIVKKENENLNKNFKIYEELYFSIATILFTCTLLLIVPFVSVYTKKITDADYIRPLFAYILVLAEFVWVIKKPYRDIVKVVGHFKQTQLGAWMEALINIVISIILVLKFGIVGVAIGTLIATIIRTIELMYYTSINILHRKVSYAYKRLGVIVLEVFIIVFAMNFIHGIEVTNYLTWCIQGIIVFLISSVIVIAIDYLIYNENVKGLINKIKEIKLIKEN